MAEISIDTGEGSRERFPLTKDRVTIGRSRDSDIFLPHQWLSRPQAARSRLAHRPLPELFEQVLDLLFAAVPAERGAIILLEGLPPEQVVKASRSRGGQAPLTKVSRSISRRVMERRETMLLPNLME